MSHRDNDDHDITDTDMRDALQELLDRGIIEADGPLDDLDTEICLTISPDVVH